MFCKIVETWEPENLSGEPMEGIVISVEWSRTEDPWTPIPGATGCHLFRDIEEFETWAAIRERHLLRGIPAERMPAGLAERIGKPHRVSDLRAGLAAARAVDQVPTKG